MGSKSIAEFRCLSQRDLALCRRANVHSVEQLLSHSIQELTRKLGVHESHAIRIRNVIQRAAAPPMQCIYDQIRIPSEVPGTPLQDEPSASLDSDALDSLAASDVFHPSTSYLTLNQLRLKSFLSTGQPALDECMGGGFTKGMVSELLGESASGKTQMLLSTTVSVALALHTPQSVLLGGKGESVALITTQGRSAARHMVHRLVEITSAQLHNLPADQLQSAIHAVLRNVSIACAFSYETAQHVLCYMLPAMILRFHEQYHDHHTPPPIGLVALDSIPPLLQHDILQEESESISVSPTARAAKLHALAEQLREIAMGSADKIAVVVVNHVSDAFDQDRAYVRQAIAKNLLGSEIPKEKSPAVVPNTHLLPLSYATQAVHFSGLLSSVQHRDSHLKTAQLGLVWANCINARFLLTHTHSHSKMRRLRVVFAPNAPANRHVDFSIESKGTIVDAIH
ncbi:DNA repair protein rhp57 [Malassezia yamatoensis]|uniref:DNA repair protein rhp57 n=1 Tax=Malassezia yamatoensis TaxID=253288 RepID=A0AAJ6CI00_9BASI|nr:DNA repair protein rhp57 [Malassezia yamatoensis]